MKYPLWICHDCGMKARKRPLPEGSVATFHKAKCDVCGEIKAVTQPRDYGYPEPEAFIWKKK